MHQLLKRLTCFSIQAPGSCFRIPVLVLTGIILSWMPLQVMAQTQVVRGIVLDRQSEVPLIGATVQVLGLEPTLGAVSDLEGRFEIRAVPTGRQALKISYIGYETQVIENVLVTSGREVQLVVKLEESFQQMTEIVIEAGSARDLPVNEMVRVSARQFNMEEVQRYSGGRNDVAKLVANFAGVASNNDARNDIIIRGNSPTGVLWRLEGQPIPNPNHFSTLGVTGGPVSALNPNLIGNSDFLTGAFPAEYGNALAGVFDINFRRGNRDRYEYTAQFAAFSGLEAMAEGPLPGKKPKGSFLIAYRYSFVELAAAAGIEVGTRATPKYNDLSFNLDLDVGKKLKLNAFGIHGNSAIDFIGSELDTTELFANPDENAYTTSRVSIFGLKANYQLSDQSYWRTTLTASRTRNDYVADDLAFSPPDPFRIINVADDQYIYAVNSFYNNKISRRFSLRTGILFQYYMLDSFTETRSNTDDLDGDGLPDWWVQRDFDDNFSLAEVYAQSMFRLSRTLTFNAGLHAQTFSLTRDAVLEPRMSVNWQLGPKNELSLGYGIHHQTVPFPVFFFQEQQPDGSSSPTNKNLKFTRNQHFVLGYALWPARDWSIKTDLYYQKLDRVPVEREPTSFSTLNAGSQFIFPFVGSLVNEGIGENYGLELTVEKFFSRGYYGLATVSLYQSRYTGSDGIWRDTAFNTRYMGNFLAGKEFNLGTSGRYVLTLDTRLSMAGGRPFTPVNLEASREQGQEVLYDELAYSERFDPYFRWDVKFGYRINSNRKKFSQTFYLDLQNITNHQNVFSVRYNESKGEVGRIYQIGFFPDVLWRIEF
jgi:hypothetical protein